MIKIGRPTGFAPGYDLSRGIRSLPGGASSSGAVLAANLVVVMRAVSGSRGGGSLWSSATHGVGILWLVAATGCEQLAGGAFSAEAVVDGPDGVLCVFPWSDELALTLLGSHHRLTSLVASGAPLPLLT